MHTFEAHEVNIEAKKLAKENLKNNSKTGHNINKRQIGTIVVSSILGSLSSSVFSAIFEAITGASNKDVVGIVDSHEDRINSLEKSMGAINHSLMSLKQMVEETKSKAHLIITLQVYANTALLNLVALRTAVNGFHSLLNGHVIPDLV